MRYAHDPRRWLAAVPAVALLLSGWCGNTVTAADAKTAAVEALLTTDTVGFLHIRVAEVWNAPGMAFYRKVLGQAGAEEIKKFDGKFVPNPSQIESLTVIMSTTRTDRDFPNGNPTALTPLWVVTTKEPIDRVDLVRSLGRESRTKAYRSTEYLFDEHNWAGVVLLDSQTLVYAAEDSIIQMIDQRADARGDSNLAALYRRESTGKAAFLMAVSPQALARPEILKEVPEKLLPLFKAKTIAGSLTLNGGTKLQIVGDFANNTHATDGQAAVKAVIDLGREQIAEALEKIRGDSANKPKRVPAGLQDLPDASGAMFGTAILKHLDNALLGLPVKVKDSQVQIEANPDEVLPDSSSMLAATWILGFAISRSFSFDYVDSSAREGEIPYELQNQFRGIHQAIEAYYRDKGSYPPAALYDNNAKPLLSWRVLILPYLEGSYNDEPRGNTALPNFKDEKGPQRHTFADLFRQFKLDEPWDSLHNKKLLAKMPSVYRKPYYYGSSGLAMKTGIQGFAGPGALFDGQKRISKDQIKDGLGSTILLSNVEDSDQMVYWTKPADVTFDPKKPLPVLTKRPSGTLYALLADGTVLALPKSFVAKSLKDAITIAGGEKAQLPQRPSDPFKDVLKPLEKLDLEDLGKTLDPQLELKRLEQKPIDEKPFELKKDPKLFEFEKKSGLEPAKKSRANSIREKRQLLNEGRVVDEETLLVRPREVNAPSTRPANFDPELLDPLLREELREWERIYRQSVVTKPEKIDVPPRVVK